MSEFDMKTAESIAHIVNKGGQVRFEYKKNIFDLDAKRLKIFTIDEYEVGHLLVKEDTPCTVTVDREGCARLIINMPGDAFRIQVPVIEKLTVSNDLQKATNENLSLEEIKAVMKPGISYTQKEIVEALGPEFKKFSMDSLTKVVYYRLRDSNDPKISRDPPYMPGRHGQNIRWMVMA